LLQVFPELDFYLKIQVSSILEAILSQYTSSQLTIWANLVSGLITILTQEAGASYLCANWIIAMGRPFTLLFFGQNISPYNMLLTNASFDLVGLADHVHRRKFGTAMYLPALAAVVPTPQTSREQEMVPGSTCTYTRAPPRY
jgi:hypothetical protein